MDPEVVILGADGTEHVFPPGFDPVKAAAIVRGGPKPLGPPNQHTATAEEFTDPSVGGFINNAVNDVKGLVGVLDVRNWRGMSDAKQAADAKLATDAHSERPAFQFPGDRLAKQLQSIPQDVYQNPVQAARWSRPDGEADGGCDARSGSRRRGLREVRRAEPDRATRRWRSGECAERWEIRIPQGHL
jgi:hypothetical protein